MSVLNPSNVAVETAPHHTLSAEVVNQLRKVPILSALRDDELHCLDETEELRIEAGELLAKQGETARFFWILLSGSLRISQLMPDGREIPMAVVTEGNAFGELPLLSNIPNISNVRALEPCHLMQLNEEQFWGLMTFCPQVRRAILGNMTLRMQKMQNVTLQQEKMAALGIMAAGLMHELNNPGAAARRAAQQLRENLNRMHELAARFTKADMSREQKECMMGLQTAALAVKQPIRMNSLEQSDAEERLAEWMEAAQVEDAWKLAPTLIAVGMNEHELDCARQSFPGEIFSDALSWLEALVSSQQLVGTIEESIGRVTDLVKAVKSYAYEGKGQRQTIDINDSIHATMVILAHKMREKEIVLEKDFGAGLPPLQSECSGLNQIWTNLLDNAIDAVGAHGHIAVRTWSEVFNDSTGKPSLDLCISVKDNGSGIPLESQPHIFDPFYTTKAVGVGTGLGLGIVYRIVEQYGGVIRFTSEPGNTEFVVRLPSDRA
ncbi:ATP-binding protein [Granulicella rosea]|nr:ATP-binding protein [Granulicella rosea]